MVPRILTVCASFPTPGRASDGQSIYIVEASRAIAEITGRPLRVLALRIGDEPAYERGDWFEVERVEPTVRVPDVFALYEPWCFPEALGPLAARAATIASAIRSRGEPWVAWCHGYEMGYAADRLRATGTPVVGVIHYLVADETDHYLSSVRDPLRARRRRSWLVCTAASIPPSMIRPVTRTLGYLSPLAARVRSSRVVVQQMRKLALERHFVGASHRIVAVGRHFADTIRAHYPGHAERIRWCHAGAPAPGSPNERVGSGERGRRLRMLIVGRPSWQKGWDYVARALSLLERQRPEVADRLELVAIGGLGAWREPHTDYAACLLRSFASLEKTRFENAGRMSRPEVRAQFARADAMLLPSVFEPFGLVLLEAMAEGCALIASDADGPRDVVDPSFGILMSFRDPAWRVDELVSAITDLVLRSSAELDRMSRAARAAAQGYRWQDCAARHLGFAREATESM